MLGFLLIFFGWLLYLKVAYLAIDIADAIAFLLEEVSYGIVVTFLLLGYLLVHKILCPAFVAGQRDAVRAIEPHFEVVDCS